MKFWITTLLFFVTASSAIALDPQDPKSLCDRFLGGDQETCEKKVSDLKPDWYLASICNRLFDDKLFFECLSMSQKHSFSPLSLEPCSADELNDMDRLKCAEGAKTSLAQSFQLEKPTRKPASLPKKK